MGFLLAISGQFVRSRIDDHIKTLEKQADINRKLTPPEVDADIGLAQDSRKHVIVIRCKNRIPFRADWRINTTKDELVRVMLREEEFLPDASRDEFIYNVKLQEDRIREDYLELRFRWRSAYYIEMGSPENLRGVLTKCYKLCIEGVPSPSEVTVKRHLIQIVRPLESIAETQPELQPAALRLSAMIPNISREILPLFALHTAMPSDMKRAQMRRATTFTGLPALY